MIELPVLIENIIEIVNVAIEMMLVFFVQLSMIGDTSSQKIMLSN